MTMQDPLSRVLFFLCIILTASIHITAQEFNVLKFGAVGDGKADDSMAFVEAWKQTCSAAAATPTMVIPAGKTFLVGPVTFAGPCKSQKISIKLAGTIVAPDGPAGWKNEKDKSKWVTFHRVDGLQIDGPGTLDGRGKGWWDISCKNTKNKKGCNKLAPTEMKFDTCKDIRMSNIAFVNSPQTHVSTIGCHGVEFGFLNIQSPGKSPNTDGIHIHDSTDVFIHNARISNGDDCISLGDHISHINITQVDCHLGHGVSIGSLGKGGGVVQVDNIKVSNVNFTETTNGARIKTWQVGKGSVKQVQFTHLQFTDVQNPIIIDQHYCDVPFACKQTDAGVHIDGVEFTNAFGTSKTEIAVNLNCSSNVPCSNINLDTIQLKPGKGNRGKKVTSYCSHAEGQAKGAQEPKACF